MLRYVVLYTGTGSRVPTGVELMSHRSTILLARRGDDQQKKRGSGCLASSNLLFGVEHLYAVKARFGLDYALKACGVLAGARTGIRSRNATC